jgi:hypothetical protein
MASPNTPCVFPSSLPPDLRLVVTEEIVFTNGVKLRLTRRIERDEVVAPGDNVLQLGPRQDDFARFPKVGSDHPCDKPNEIVPRCEDKEAE